MFCWKIDGRPQAYMNEKLTAGDIVGLCPLLYQTAKLLRLADEVYVNTCEEYGISREDAEANKEIPKDWTPTEWQFEKPFKN